jgi:hypothetical protein
MTMTTMTMTTMTMTTMTMTTTTTTRTRESVATVPCLELLYSEIPRELLQNPPMGTVRRNHTGRRPGPPNRVCVAREGPRLVVSTSRHCPTIPRSQTGACDRARFWHRIWTLVLQARLPLHHPQWNFRCGPEAEAEQEGTMTMTREWPSWPKC